MDLLEVYFSFLNLNRAIKLIDLSLFEECYKYHILSQMGFTIFATFSGISAFIMSLGLLANYNLFVNKFLDTFMYMNYMIFGPLLLSASLLGCFYFSEVVYNCDKKNSNTKFLNMSTLFSIFMCFVISISISFGYSIIYSSPALPARMVTFFSPAQVR